RHRRPLCPAAPNGHVRTRRRSAPLPARIDSSGWNGGQGFGKCAGDCNDWDSIDPKGMERNVSEETPYRPRRASADRLDEAVSPPSPDETGPDSGQLFRGDDPDATLIISPRRAAGPITWFDDDEDPGTDEPETTGSRAR